MTRVSRIAFTSLTTGSLLLSAACSLNPATGKRQLNLYSESQEIALGRGADPQIVAQYGLYPDEDLQRYVSELGQSLAAQSERPNLPWTFRVVDDPVVNAFALPGGFIYITRGILAHLGSEAELAGVLGHEIGHVTARHGVNQMTKAQLAQVGLVAGVIAAPEMAEQFGSLAQQATSMLFLKFGRDDERQADALGFRYMTRVDEPPGALADVFRTLGRVSAAAGSDRLPSFQSTHPAPEDREERIRRMLDSTPPELANAPPHRARYQDQIDGVSYGEDPRQGFFRDNVFYHPDLAFELTFPSDWKMRNTRQAVSAIQPDQKAAVVLTLAEGTDAGAAADRFFEQEGVESAGHWINRNGLASSQFRLVQDEQERFRGGVAFAELDDRVYQLVAYALPDDWSGYEGAAERAVRSLRRLRGRYLDAEPRRLEMITLRRDMTLEAFARAHPSSVELDELARINQLDDPSAHISAGTRLKHVVGTDYAKD